MPRPTVRASVRVDGPLEPAKGNVYEPVIRQPNGSTLVLNACTLGLAISFCERWNAKTNSDQAYVRFVEDRAAKAFTPQESYQIPCGACTAGDHANCKSFLCTCEHSYHWVPK